jgi:hypothetical protein
MDRLINAVTTGLKVALLAQSPILVISLIAGLTLGTPGNGATGPGFEAVGRWLWSCTLTFGPPLAVLGFLVGATLGEPAGE